MTNYNVGHCMDDSLLAVVTDCKNFGDLFQFFYLSPLKGIDNAQALATIHQFSHGHWTSK